MWAVPRQKMPPSPAPFWQARRAPSATPFLLNAGASLYIGGKAETVAEGIALAVQLIDSGKAAAVLEKFIEVSNRPEENA